MGLDSQHCEVYWGSHGCDRGASHTGYHRCDCAGDDVVICPERDAAGMTSGSRVGAFPYYGPSTMFYGEDANIDLVLTSADPEPPVGVTVEDATGREWTRDEHSPACWTRDDIDDDPETWTKVAGNYGPVRVRVAALFPANTE